MKPTFGKRLTASYLFVVVVTLLATGFLLSRRLEKTFLNNLEQSLSIQARLIAQNLPPNLNDLQSWAREEGRLVGYRITVKNVGYRFDPE